MSIININIESYNNGIRQYGNNEKAYGQLSMASKAGVISSSAENNGVMSSLKARK
jgi:hypothetical protein